MAHLTPPNPLSKEDFLALGEDKIVYRRHLTGKQLKAMFPEAEDAPEQAEFEALFAANGTPVLITDDSAALRQWLSDTGHNVTVRH